MKPDRKDALGNELKWGDRLVRIDSPNYLSVADVKNGTTRTNGYTEFILTPDKLNWISGVSINKL
jgi:hypothetical protein